MSELWSRLVAREDGVSDVVRFSSRIAVGLLKGVIVLIAALVQMMMAISDVGEGISIDAERSMTRFEQLVVPMGCS